MTADDLTLVVMAAGIGSRFGGTKQLAEVGPDGEAFLDFAIADAAAAGVTRTVVIVRGEIEDDVRTHVRRRHGQRDVVYVRQDDHGPSRSRPWGTAHAVLAAASAVDGPFMVCNADDYYGASSYDVMADAAAEMGDDEALLAGFRLEHTLAESGSVSRGICSVRRGRLVSVVEHSGISRDGRGVITAREPSTELDEGSITSMNLWAFPRSLFARLEHDFERFLSAADGEDEAEFQLPTVVSEMMADGELTVSVVPTAEPWVGVTHPADLDIARRRIAMVRGR